MKTLRAVVLCVLALLAVTTLAAAQQTPEQEVRALLEQARVAALKSDAGFFASYFSDDLVRIDVRGLSVTKEQAIRAVRNGDVTYSQLDARSVDVAIYGDTAVVHVLYEFKSKNRGEDQSGINRVTRVLIKQGGKWREVAFQATRVQ